MDIIEYLTELVKDLESAVDSSNIKERIDLLFDQKFSLFYEADLSRISNLLQRIKVQLRDKKIRGVKNQSFEDAANLREAERNIERLLYLIKPQNMNDHKADKLPGIQIPSPSELANLWIDFIESDASDKDWTIKYENDKDWTEATIGRPVAEETKSPFGKFVEERTGLRYRKEDGLFDLAFGLQDKFIDVESLHERNEDRKPLLQESFYPTEYAILLEHENSIYHCSEEMAKLAYVRAPLKVLITYNENADGKKDYSYITEIVVKNFEKIISQANRYYPENPETKYLLIIGQLIQDVVNWKVWNFDCHGNSKSLN